MLFRALILSLPIVAGLWAVEARKTPEEYAASGAVTDMKIGADYLVTSFSDAGQTFTIDDYLVVELGIYPQRETKVDVRRFNLRINGKQLLAAQMPGMVAASVKYPDWTQKPRLEGTAGPIIVGRPPVVGRFPGDPTATRLPRPTTAPPSASTPEKPEVDYGQLIRNAALQEGPINKPIAGFLYFPFSGKLKSIRTVELLVDETTLKLR